MVSNEYTSSETRPTDVGMAGCTTAEVTDFGAKDAGIKQKPRASAWGGINAHPKGFKAEFTDTQSKQRVDGQERSILFQGENPVVYNGSEFDNSSTNHRRLQAGYSTPIHGIN